MRKDVLIDDSGDLDLSLGDFVVGPSDVQHVKHIVEMFKGEQKEYPLVGFGALNYLKSDVSKVEFKRDLKVQLELDDYKNPDIDLKDGFEQLKIKV